MAQARKKNTAAIHFELTWWGLFGLGIGCFCIFIWMFLLGVWAGQTVLMPPSDRIERPELKSLADSVLNEISRMPSGSDIGRPAATTEESIEESVIEDQAAAGATPDAPPATTSFFALQVASFKDLIAAERSVASWSKKDSGAFLLPLVTDDGTLYRVFLGRFDNLADANARATKLNRDEGVQAYITLLPATAAGGT